MSAIDDVTALHGAVIEFLAASHASLVESYTEDSDAHADLVLSTADLVLSTIVRLRDACIRVIGEHL